ncbi:glycosyl hydrolase 115 family protein [Henriciella sp.]|uniref:glycosyl hydrolase 115 family protein n=1 Tax=Henriciella sp. TaxID=1968823 RepID=UPI0026342FF5|nr:glycosyl hydrolase 115 family protein [Henriciella sp.]
MADAQPQAVSPDEANSNPAAVSEVADNLSFPLFGAGKPTTILVDPAEDPGILRAVRDLQSDLEARGPIRPVIRTEIPKEPGQMIVVGSLENSRWLSPLLDSGQVSTQGLSGEWEAFSQEVVDAPYEGVERALVIAGSDKRGTIYGIYDLLDRAGVSPWAWWADVPIEKTGNLYVSSGRRLEKPSVKYRGIFLNDENPALFGWANKTFGGFNHAFYERVFELILRQKGNYLWPAMWGKAFYDDDPMNAELADEMGIVIGTSHHEPLGRAHIEWERYGEGDWNYQTNAGNLRDFWRFGMDRIGGREALVTIGMRGDGDEAMSEGTAIDLLETIVSDQRSVIADVTGKPASQTPQIWALYKEVQDYYDQGMDVPDDVTLLFADDNWGNLRRLPEPGAERRGGYGVYYHFDYVGGPRNYKWINTTQIERVWEQMGIAYDYGAREAWIVNVGDLKPMELPISFFLDYAWDPSDIPLENLDTYTRDWAAQQFPDAYANEIAALLEAYTKYNARRKPELLDADTYSVVNFSEFERVSDEYQALAERAAVLREELPEAYDDAFVQLVWFPVTASANLNALYYTTALNRLYAEQGRARTNGLAEKAAELFARDDQLRRVYEEEIAGGKWVDMMSQTHIGYTYWQQPDVQSAPDTERIEMPEEAGFGVAVPGSRENWAARSAEAVLPQVDVLSRHTAEFEVFNTGQAPYEVTVTPLRPWVSVSDNALNIEMQKSVTLAVDWGEAPLGLTRVPVEIDAGLLGTKTLHLPVFKPENAADVSGLVEADGFISVDAAAASRIFGGEDIEWSVIPNLGRTGDSIVALPATAPASEPGSDSPRLEYDLWLFERGKLDVTITLAPTQDFKAQGGLHYALSIDDQAPVLVNAVEAEVSGEGDASWEKSVAQYAHEITTRLSVDEPGAHTLKLWRVDPGLVFQHVTVATRDLPETYLAPPGTPQCEASDTGETLPDCSIPVVSSASP